MARRALQGLLDRLGHKVQSETQAQQEFKDLPGLMEWMVKTVVQGLLDRLDRPAPRVTLATQVRPALLGLPVTQDRLVPRVRLAL